MAAGASPLPIASVWYWMGDKGWVKYDKKMNDVLETEYLRIKANKKKLAAKDQRVKVTVHPCWKKKIIQYRLHLLALATGG
jgi:hypothetical protein